MFIEHLVYAKRCTSHALFHMILTTQWNTYYYIPSE